MAQICCLLGTILPFRAWPHGQGIGGQLAIGRSGQIKSDSLGQPHVLLGGVCLAEPTQGPVETTGAWGLHPRNSVSVPFLFRTSTPASALEECSLAAFLPTPGKRRCPETGEQG